MQIPFAAQRLGRDAHLTDQLTENRQLQNRITEPKPPRPSGRHIPAEAAPTQEQREMLSDEF